MFTICIPIYNYDVGELAHTLHRQALQTGLPFEILLMDDASGEEYQKKNSAIDLPYLRYIRLPENVGRARIRNLLSKQARYPYLIFMDCDSTVPSDDYVTNYIPHFKPDMVCCGGRIYENERPSGKKYLHWKYGKEREARPAKKRKEKPNFGFMTCNFLIHKPLLEKYPFNENITDYGHEDTFFGIQLSEQGVFIRHIDNPLIHSGLEDADVFIAKTEKALFNLRKMDKLLQEKYPRSVKHSSLIRMEKMLERFHFIVPVAWLFPIFSPLIKMNLLGRYPSLFLLDLYKLGIFCSLK
jgi:glycosyltransferase involved in cell wall biosynthesis